MMDRDRWTVGVTRVQLYPGGYAVAQDLLRGICSRGLLEVLVEELRDHAARFIRVERGPAVTGAGDDLQGRVDAGLLESRVQHFALLQPDDRILVAVNDQERRRHLRNVRGRAGLT